MTTTEKIYQAMTEHPDWGVKDIATEVGATYSSTKSLIYKMRKKGLIDKKDNTFITLREFSSSEGMGYKQNVYRQMVDTYVDDFESASGYAERIEIGKLILRILERI